MKIIIAPDSFKNSLRAGNAAAALAAGWRMVRPQDELVLMPMSDGGEGICEALVESRGGDYIRIDCTDPLLRKRVGKAGITGGFAVLESAEANGIELLDRSELDPLRATTWGVGQMLKVLLCEYHCRKVVIGIGGSATVDGGAGMLQALGAKFYRADGTLLPDGIGGGMLAEIAAVDESGLLPELKDCELLVACDVTNILCGAEGSAAVFGPQKGASPEMVKILDANLGHFARICGECGDSPGDGAAGGLGFALRHLGAKSMPGAQLVMEQTGFTAALDGAALVITGEGCSDNQTACGKLCSSIAVKAAEHRVPSVLVSGALSGDCRGLEKIFAGCFSISRGVCTLDEALKDTAVNLEKCAASLAAFAGVFAK